MEVGCRLGLSDKSACGLLVEPIAKRRFSIESILYHCQVCGECFSLEELRVVTIDQVGLGVKEKGLPNYLIGALLLKLLFNE